MMEKQIFQEEKQINKNVGILDLKKFVVVLVSFGCNARSLMTGWLADVKEIIK